MMCLKLSLMWKKRCRIHLYWLMKSLSIIERLVQEKIFWGNILLYNRDISDLEESLLDFLDGIQENFSWVYYHSDFRAFNNLVKNFSYKNLVYQKDIDKKGEFEKFLKIITHHKILPPTDFTLWFSHENIIPILLKAIKLIIWWNVKLTKKDDTNYILDYWKIKIRLYDNTKIDHKYLSTCFFDNSIKFSESNSLSFDTNIFSLDCLEITQNGDICPHEPPYGQISNVFRSREEISTDFKNFSSYITSFISENQAISQQEICKLCRRKQYTYK